jgi:hypothetical protein
VRSVALAVVLAVVASCNLRDPCFEQIEGGKTYRVTVVEPYVEGGNFSFDPAVAKSASASCGRGFDFSAGDTLKIRSGRERLSLSCWTREAEPSDLANVTLGKVELPAGGATDGPTALVTARYEATVGSDCPGHLWEVQIDVYGGQPFAESVPGQLPSVVMVRRFSPTRPFAPGCHRPGATTSDTVNGRFDCRDAFVVRLERVP